MEKHKLFHENGITSILASSITILGVPLLESTSHPSQVTGAPSCWFTCLVAESRSSHGGRLGGLPSHSDFSLTKEHCHPKEETPRPGHLRRTRRHRAATPCQCDMGDGHNNVFSSVFLSVKWG